MPARREKNAGTDFSQPQLLLSIVPAAQLYSCLNLRLVRVAQTNFSREECRQSNGNLAMGRNGLARAILRSVSGVHDDSTSSFDQLFHLLAALCCGTVGVNTVCTNATGRRCRRPLHHPDGSPDRELATRSRRRPRSRWRRSFRRSALVRSAAGCRYSTG